MVTGRVIEDPGLPAMVRQLAETLAREAEPWKRAGAAHAAGYYAHAGAHGRTPPEAIAEFWTILPAREQFAFLDGLIEAAADDAAGLRSGGR